MTDLEITKLCAEAMGIKTIERAVGPRSGQSPALQLGDAGPGPIEWYDPLHDDAQAMALVKKFGINIEGSWTAYTHFGDGPFRKLIQSNDINLNRAICLCIARMQQAKAK